MGFVRAGGSLPPSGPGARDIENTKALSMSWAPFSVVMQNLKVQAEPLGDHALLWLERGCTLAGGGGKQHRMGAWGRAWL